MRARAGDENPQYYRDVNIILRVLHIKCYLNCDSYAEISVEKSNNERSLLFVFSCSYGPCDQYGPGAGSDNQLHPVGRASCWRCEANSGAGRLPGHLSQREAPCQGYGALLTRVRSRSTESWIRVSSYNGLCFLKRGLKITRGLWSCNEASQD